MAGNFITQYKDLLGQRRSFENNFMKTNPQYKEYQNAIWAGGYGSGDNAPDWSGAPQLDPKYNPYDNWLNSLDSQTRKTWDTVSKQYYNMKDNSSFGKITNTLGDVLKVGVPLAVGGVGLAGTGLLGAGAQGLVGGATGAAAPSGLTAAGLESIMGIPELGLAGQTGLGTTAGAAATPGLGGLGSLGGISTTDAAAAIGGAVPTGLGGGGDGITGGGFPGEGVSSGIPSWDNAPTGNSVSDFIKKALGAISGVGGGLDTARLVSSLAGLYGSYQDQKNYRDAAGSIKDLFGNDSAYAENLRNELQRRDAAAGRRSQYGPRAVELQAKLAELAARQTPSLMNLYSQQSDARNNSLTSFLNILNSTGLMGTPSRS